eukprot:4482436-Heterocapsa_arctica.AAC.1
MPSDFYTFMLTFCTFPAWQFPFSIRLEGEHPLLIINDRDVRRLHVAHGAAVHRPMPPLAALPTPSFNPSLGR